MQAYSEATGKTYDSYEELVKAESNGWLVTALVTRGDKTWPWSYGPFAEKSDAERHRNRVRGKWNRTKDRYPTTTWKFFVRPAWKVDR